MHRNNVSQKEKYFWNMMGSLCNSFSTLVLLWMVNWVLGSDEGGVFSFAYTNAQLMLVIGCFEVRPIQSTDIKEKYSFSTYFTLRIITCALMMGTCIIYTYISKFESNKSNVVIMLSIFKMVEAFADIFGGMYQQKDRIDLTGKAFTFRVVFSTMAFGFVILITKNLFAGTVAMVVTSFLLFFLYDLKICRFFTDVKIVVGFNKIISLTKEVLPLFVGAFIMSYINSAPKYAINAYCSDDLQNKYTILFMPAFVINLFSIFVFRPVLVDMAKKWNIYDIVGVINYIKRSSFFILITTIVCIIGSVTVGIPVLSYFYNVNLSGEKIILVWVMIYGGFSAFCTYFYCVIVSMRAHSKILIGYIAAFIMASILSPCLVKQMGLFGAVMASLISLFVLDIIFGVIILMAIYKHEEEKKENAETI